MKELEPRWIEHPQAALELLDGLEALTREYLRELGGAADPAPPHVAPQPRAPQPRTVATRPLGAASSPVPRKPPPARRWTCREEYRPALSNPDLLRALGSLKLPEARKAPGPAVRERPAPPPEPAAPAFAPVRFPEVEARPKPAPLRPTAARTTALAQPVLSAPAAPRTGVQPRRRNLAVPPVPPNLP